MAHFNISARTLIHLGAELITSDEIALYEIIKNAFDASSKRVNVKFLIPINNNIIIEIIDELTKIKTLDHDKKIEIIESLKENIREDVDSDIKNNTLDKIKKIRSLSTPRKVISVLESINEIEILDSGNGMSREVLESVFLCVGTPFKLEKEHSHPDRTLLGNKGIGRLSMMRLGNKALVSSWTEKYNEAFSIEFDWNEFSAPDKYLEDIELNLEQVSKPDHSISGTKIKITSLTSDWSLDRIENNLINSYLRRLKNPFSRNEINFPIDIYYNNSERLAIKPPSQELWNLADRNFKLIFSPGNVRKKDDIIIKVIINEVKKETLPFTDDISLFVFQEKLDIPLKHLNAIGPFTLHLRWFNRRNLTKEGLGKSLKGIRKELDIWSGGIAIYRDGFRIGLTGSDKDGDWLGIDSSALKRGGFLVNKIQTVGALEITKNDNANLVDRSNREGLIENTDTINLREILIEFGLSTLREYISAENEIESNITLENFIEKGTSEIEDKINQAYNNISKIGKEHKLPSEVKETVIELNNNLHFIENEIKKYNNAFIDLQETREDILELAGVGTVMHSVLHELTRTTNQTRFLLTEISKNSDPQTKDLLKKLEKEIKSINIRLSQLDPLSPNKRQRKDKFDIVKLTRTIISGYNAREIRHNIKIKFTVDDIEPLHPVMVNMVEGFYSLALENLLSNSFFWLKKGVMNGADKDDKFISVDIDSKSKTLTFFDNGPGIDPKYKERIFNPGFSLKKNGNGFGLYIAREVAAHHNAKIELDSHIDSDGRYRTFVFELPRD
ncbi:sensor histidine kinase [Pectobacterium carotovorum]|uniref:sensor histidine kinase n=1 Tax=Pectobacterium carotovorum TaxID=554 RepID=UPI003018D74D